MVDDEHLRHSLREPELLDWIRQNGCGLRVLGCWVPQCAKMFDSCCSWSVSLHKFSPRFSPVLWSILYELFRTKTKQTPIPSSDVIKLSKIFSHWNFEERYHRCDLQKDETAIMLCAVKTFSDGSPSRYIGCVTWISETRHNDKNRRERSQKI